MSLPNRTWATGPLGLPVLTCGLLLICGGQAAWSYPAGSKIAFAVNTTPDGRSSRILIAAPDGSNIRAVTEGKSRDRAPAFSPDGKSLAYQSTNDLGLDTVVIYQLSGNRSPRTLAVGAQPQWSRDGQRLLFSRRQLNEYYLYVIRADGSEKDAGLKPLTKGQMGRWSPDEKQLAVVAPVILEGQDRWQIQILNSETLQPRFTMTLPEAYGQVISLDWSPAGDGLLFSVSRQDHYDLYALDLKSPEPKRIPAGSGNASTAPNPAYGSWSPDGEEILFRTMSDASGEGNGSSRLNLVKADGTALRTIWEPSNKPQRIHGTAWYRPPVLLAAEQKPPKQAAASPAPTPVNPQPAPPQPAAPAPAAPGAPANTGPAGQTVTIQVPGTPKKVHKQKLFVVDRQRSPVSVPLATPDAGDFALTIPLLPAKSWNGRRQGVGVTLELEDGSLYRGTVIYSGSPWATIQGRPKGGKVRLVDGKQLPPTVAGFKQGFKLTVRRDDQNLVVAVNNEVVLSRPVLDSPVKRAYVTLENFDAGKAYFPLGNIYYQPAAEPKVSGTSKQ